MCFFPQNLLDWKFRNCKTVPKPHEILSAFFEWNTTNYQLLLSKKSNKKKQNKTKQTNKKKQENKTKLVSDCYKTRYHNCKLQTTPAQKRASNPKVDNFLVFCEKLISRSYKLMLPPGSVLAGEKWKKKYWQQMLLEKNEHESRRKNVESPGRRDKTD